MSKKMLNINYEAADSGTSNPDFMYNNYSDIVTDPHIIPIRNTIKPQTGGMTPITPADFVVPKNPQILSLNISATVYDKDGVVPGVNISVGGVNYTPTDLNGNFRLVNIANNETVTFSFIGLKTASFPVMELPKKVVLEIDKNELTEVIVLKKKTTNFWWILAVLGLAYGGYRYSLNSKKNKIIKTKI